MAVTTALVIAGLATVAGAGISAYGSYAQAKSSERMANYNAAVQRQQNDVNLRMAQRQNDINNAAIQAQVVESRSLDNQARATMDAATEQNRRADEEKRRLMASQRAGYAKSGVLIDGSPLAVLADTAGLFEMQANDTAFQADLQARSLTREGQLKRSGLLQDSYMESLKLKGAQAAYKIGGDQANIIQLQGKSDAQGYRYQAGATLLSGIGSAASQYKPSGSPSKPAAKN